MKETAKHIAAYEFYRDQVKRSIAKVAIEFSVSETSINKWNKAFKWQRRIAAWDIAIREGVEEAAIEAVVDTRIKELEQTDRMMAEIKAVKPVLLFAIESCTCKDEKTGKRVLKELIKPRNTLDMAALYNATARLNVTEIKIVELARKIRGEVDKVEVTGSLKHELTAEPDILKAANELAQMLSKRE